MKEYRKTVEDRAWWLPGRAGWMAYACPAEAFTGSHGPTGAPLAPVGYEFMISWSCNNLKIIVWQLVEVISQRPQFDWPPPNDRELKGGLDG